ncbi:MAG TPA: hypothetical protein IAC01_02625 [Candidatus Limicola stercorigallinarum]|nr:hypothetical protein [Candidatus Limicola stercorigallinarum]
MSIPVLIIGEPGSGKSSSMRGFAEDELGVIQTIAKPLPFRSNLKVARSRSFEKVRSWLLASKKYRAMMVDDFGYLITDTYIKYSYGTEKLYDQYEVFKIIGGEVYNLINALNEDGQDDRIVYLTMHIERDNFGHIEPATVGKMLNEKVKLVGMFTIVIMATSDGGDYRFITNGQPLKSPMGMFPQEMPNDLKQVDTLIREYWGIAPLKDTEKKGNPDETNRP